MCHPDVTYLPLHTQYMADMYKVRLCSGHADKGQGVQREQETGVWCNETHAKGGKQVGAFGTCTISVMPSWDLCGADPEWASNVQHKCRMGTKCTCT